MLLTMELFNFCVVFFLVSAFPFAIEATDEGRNPLQRSNADDIDLTQFIWNMFRGADDEETSRGLVYSSFKVYQHFFGVSKKELMGELKKVEQQVAEIQALVDELTAEVQEESIRTQYVTSSRIISESLRCYNNFALMQNISEQQGTAYWRREFLKYGSLVRESVNFLLDGLLGTGFIASDIMQTAHAISKGDKAKFVDVTGNYIAQLNAGLLIHATYMGVNNQSERVNSPVVDQFDVHYYKASGRFNDTIKQWPTLSYNSMATRNGTSPAAIDENQHIRSPAPFNGKPKTIFGAIFGIIVDMSKVYAAVSDPNKMINLLDEVKNIEEQLDGVKSDLKDIIGLVKDASIRTQYVSAQRVIMESLRIADYYANMTEVQGLNTTQDDIDYWHTEFGKWGSLVRESVNFLMDGLLGNGIIASDILKEITIIEKHNPKGVEARFNRFMGIVNAGIIVHAMYVRYNNISNITNAPVLDEFKLSYNTISTRFNQTRDGQEWEPDVLGIMRDFLSKSSSCSELGDILGKRYNQRSWFVGIYQAGKTRKGYPIGYFDDSFYEVWNVNGRSAAAISIPTNLKMESNRFDSTELEKIRRGFDCDKKRYKDEGLKHMSSSIHYQIAGVNTASIVRREKKNDIWSCFNYNKNEIDVVVHGCKFDFSIWNSLIHYTDTYIVPPTRPYTVPEEEHVFHG